MVQDRRKNNEPRGKQFQSFRICPYCGIRKARSRDHVPPACLFSKPLPSNLVTVKCCVECNQAFKNDDEHFRQSLGILLDRDKDAGADQLIDRSIRALERPDSEGMRKSFFSTLEVRRLVGATGIDYGMVLTSNVNTQRIVRTADRIIRGLFYKKCSYDHCSDILIYSEVIHPPGTEVIAKDCIDDLRLVHSQPANRIGDGFYYKFFQAEDDKLSSLWLLSFWDRLMFYGVTIPRSFYESETMTKLDQS